MLALQSPSDGHTGSRLLRRNSVREHAAQDARADPNVQRGHRMNATTSERASDKGAAAALRGRGRYSRVRETRDEYDASGS